MARWTPVPVAGGAYTDDCLPWASQDCVNYIPVMAEKAGTRSPAMLRGLPGCTSFSITGSDAPVRAMRNVEGRLLTVSGNALYRIGTDGAAVSLGTIPGVARCSLAHNQVTGGHEVAIANGQSGYIYNTADDTLTQITDEGFPGAKVFGFLDGYFLYVEPQGRFWGWSDLAAGTSYNTLDRAESEAQPDRIVTGIVTHGEWLVLGEYSGEFYFNSGSATGTFKRREGTTMEVGCAGTHAIASIDNSVIWVGHDGIVYRLEGYQPRRISTHALEQALSRCNLSQAFATVFEDRGHKVWYLTCPDGKTWGYDVATGEWHRRRSDGLDRWRMNALVRWRNTWMAGDYSNGRVYQLDWAIQHEDGAEMERLRTLPVAHDNGNKLTINALRFEFDTGLSEASTPLPTPLPRDALTITGNLPDGNVGDSGSVQYVVSGGFPPYGPVTIAGGALPDGAAMDAGGLATYAYTTPGSFAFTPSVTDAAGTTATVDDTAEVASVGYTSWIVTGAGTDQGYLITDGETWNGAITYLAPPFQGDRVATNGIEIIQASTSSGIYSANEGASWAPMTGLGAQTNTDAAYVNGAWLMSANTGQVKRSTNGTAYSIIATGDGLNLNCISATPTLVLVAGYRCHASADNGATFTYRAAFPFTGSHEIRDLANDGAMFMAVGDANKLATTTDGVAFSPLVSPFAGVNAITHVAYASGVWIIANAAGQIARSVDAGATWAVNAFVLGSIVKALHGYGPRFAIGNGAGALAVTNDAGITWALATESFGEVYQIKTLTVTP